MSIFDINKLTKCSIIRNKQLILEQKIDERLQKCDNRIINEYLFAFRQFNRTLSNKLYTTSLLNIPSVMIENLELMDNHLNIIYNMNDICNELQNFTNEFTK